MNMTVGGESNKLYQLRERIRHILQSKLLEKDSEWYLISSEWWKAWEAYVGSTISINSSSNINAENDKSNKQHPGHIDNSSLLEKSSGKLKRNLIEQLDFMLVPAEVWNELFEVYGISPGQIPIKRRVIETGMFVKSCKVEIYPVELRFCRASQDTEALKCFFEAIASRQSKLITVVKEAARELHLNDDQITTLRIYQKHNDGQIENLTDKLNDTLSDIGLCSEQLLLIDVPDSISGKYAFENITSAATGTLANATSGSGNRLMPDAIAGYLPTSTTRSGTIYSPSAGGAMVHSMSSGSIPTGIGESGGLCGLSNLGNTCFMNSALQCMTHVRPLVEYFVLSSDFENEINEANPLGMRGQMARVFAELMRNMWSGQVNVFVPRAFKMTVGRFAPQFSGYQQQDSQELMAFLLDGLHEDLNRIRVKPYIADKDSENRSDEEVAVEAWNAYKLRNDSVIIDLFHGQLKSTVTCPECSKVSITFDPFCYLSLPLPMKKERVIRLNFVPTDTNLDIFSFKVTISKQATIADLLDKFAKMANAQEAKYDISPNRVILGDITGHRFYKIYKPSESVSIIRDEDVLGLYELNSDAPSINDPDTTIVQVFHRVQKESSPTVFAINRPPALFGFPFVTTVNSKDIKSYDVLKRCADRCAARFMVRSSNAVGFDSDIANNNDAKANRNWWWKNDRSSSSLVIKETGDDSGLEENESDDAIMEEVTNSSGENQVPQPYSLSLVNGFGTTTMENIKPDEPYVVPSSAMSDFPSVLYLAIDWHTLAEQRLYDHSLNPQSSSKNAFDQSPSQNTFMGNKKQKAVAQIRLEDCIELFMQEERLGEHDSWFCPRCKKHQQAMKKMDIWALPNYLIIHMKRFSYTRWSRDKIEGGVDCPLEGLDMQPFVINRNHGPAVYDLIAVSNHYGGLGGGHYTAAAKHHCKEKWYYFDDSMVSSLANTEDVVTRAAYVLVYERRKEDNMDLGDN